MTFSIVGRCGRTGMFGVAIATSSICVGARCPHARAGVGAVASQNITDPALGPRTLDQIAKGHDADDALARAIAGRPHLDYRQIIVVDKTGTTASYTGNHILGIHAVATGEDCVAAGNLLSSVEVPAAMADTFAAGPRQHLAKRLLRALEAGLGAGGEQGPVHSSALLIAHQQPFALVDLRCDWDDDDPVNVLRGLWTDYEPQMDAYVTRALDPPSAPTYGVPGDV
ncbi:MAG TPA: DUF1028 domain-containing protein [Aestuariivirgaceae bacterium]|nr:DUF1028 domain-containing protein [Aestuariivirgaceae bacterium]